MSLRTFKLFLRCALAAIALASQSGWVLAGDPKNHFRKEIKLPELKEKQLVAISPDSDLFQNGSVTFGDVRIVDEWGRPQPVTDWMVKVPTPRKFKGGISVNDLRLKRLPDGTTEARFRMPPEARGQRVVGIDTMPRSENFEVHAKLFGVGLKSATAESTEVRTLLGEGDLFDYRGFLPLSKYDFPTEFGSYPEYLLVLDRPTFKDESKLIGLALDWGVPVREEAFLDRYPLYYMLVQIGTEGKGNFTETQYTSRSPRSMKVTQDPATAMTIVDIETSGEPIVSVSPIFAEKEYYRPCDLYVDRSSGAGEPQWERISNEDLLKIHYKNLSDEVLEMKFKECTAKKFRLKINNSYLPALDLQEVKYKYPERELVFFAEPGRKLWVEYGDKTCTNLVEHFGPIQYLLANGAKPVLADLGPEEVWESRGPVYYLLRHPLLWGGVGLVFVVIFAVYKILTRAVIKKAV